MPISTWFDENFTKCRVYPRQSVACGPGSASFGLTQNLEGKIKEPTLADSDQVAEFHQRLSSPSWFMKTLRENIARGANASEQITGAFWQIRVPRRNTRGSDGGSRLKKNLP